MDVDDTSVIVAIVGTVIAAGTAAYFLLNGKSTNTNDNGFGSSK